MKKCRIGILLLALLVSLAGCVRDKTDGNVSDTTTTTDHGSPLVPSPDETTTSPETTDRESASETGDESGSASQSTHESESASETTKGESDVTTTTTKSETTTKQETTTTKPETTTKQETTTTKPETTTTTTRQETTTTGQETTTTRQETTVTIDPNAPILPGPDDNNGLLPGGSESESGSANGSESSTPNGSGTESSSETRGESTTQDNNANGSNPDIPESGAGEWIHFEDFDNNHAGAAAFLGRSAQELPVTDIIEHFGLSLTPQDITVIDNGDSEDADSDEWYLILPRYRDTVVRLHDAETENGTTVAGELLAEGMHPILVRCDPEDGTPSVFVELIRGEEKITFSLMVDKESGKVTFHDKVLNITPEQVTGRARSRRR